VPQPIVSRRSVGLKRGRGTVRHRQAKRNITTGAAGKARPEQLRALRMVRDRYN